MIQRIADPCSDIACIVAGISCLRDGGSVIGEEESVDIGLVAAAKNHVYKIIGDARGVQFYAVDCSPEMPPSSCQDARPHSLHGRQEGQDFMKDGVRQSAYQVGGHNAWKRAQVLRNPYRDDNKEERKMISKIYLVV